MRPRAMSSRSTSPTHQPPVERDRGVDWQTVEHWHASRYGSAAEKPLRSPPKVEHAWLPQPHADRHHAGSLLLECDRARRRRSGQPPRRSPGLIARSRPTSRTPSPPVLRQPQQPLRRQTARTPTRCAARSVRVPRRAMRRHRYSGSPASLQDNSVPRCCQPRADIGGAPSLRGEGP